MLTTVASTAIDYLTETRERHRLRRTFARYVPAQHVEQLVEEGVERLQEKDVMSTILFCDLRDFSTLSEPLQPRSMMAMMNQYLERMGRAIEEHDGTIVSYQGDGILAAFGAPVEFDDHADCALAAAIEMVARLEAFNDWVAANAEIQAELPPKLRGHRFDMGIGLCSGLVTSGTAGFDERLSYAAVGDTTNTASRMQGMTKDTPHPLFVHDSTRVMLRHGWAQLRQLDNREIRGRDAETMIWVLRDAYLPTRYLSGDERDTTLRP